MDRSGRKIISAVLAASLTLSSVMLGGCSVADIQRASAQIEEINDAINGDGQKNFSNPDSVVEYLKGQEEPAEEVVEEEEPVNYISYNFSQKGYDRNGLQYCVMVDSQGECPTYSIVELSDYEGEDEVPTIADKQYSKIADEIIGYLNSYYSANDITEGTRPLEDAQLKKAIMQQANILLYLEYFADGDKTDVLKRLANVIAYQIYESADINNNDIILKYNCAAILAKSVYVLDDLECKAEASEQAVHLWEDAESVNSDDQLVENNRAWAGAELFRMTGAKTYRTIVEAISEEIELNGTSYDNPGYFAVFAYLSSSNKTNYETSSTLMNAFVTDANARIKEDARMFFDRSINEDNLLGDELAGEFINEAADDCLVVAMAQHISMSVEYTGYIENRLIFLFGANPVGIDFYSDDNIMNYTPVLFALCGM